MRPIFLGFQADEEPILVTAADGRVSKYTNSKIARDHENFKKVIGSFYKARDKAGRRKNARFDWKKIFTRKHAVHHFSHGHPITPTVIIKRKHIDNEPHYTVRVKMPK
ncbi:MAG: hypothetical protein KGH75_13885, partial [Rhodospirillales bacterium]|nr:hypothetical protein [Rhodospirillales bacterium]